jgi:hypothetical protein
LKDFGHTTSLGQVIKQNSRAVPVLRSRLDLLVLRRNSFCKFVDSAAKMIHLIAELVDARMQRFIASGSV